MRRLLALVCSTLFGGGLLVVALASAGAVSAATCTATGFYENGINLTAAQINPTSVTGTVASNCDIGVYFDSVSSGTVSGATISGETYYGVLVNGATDVTVTRTTISQIGNSPLNGDQYGVAVAYVSGSTGAISDNSISSYQKNGIEVDGTGTSVDIMGNTVTGQGVGFGNAQNGIQISDGASAPTVSGNTVTENIYTESAAKGYVATGILLYLAGTTPTVGQIASSNDSYRNQVNIANF